MKHASTLFCLLLLFCCVSGTVHAQYDESTVKAVYIGRFAQFVDIPHDSAAVITIGVFEKQGLTPSLMTVYKTIRIKGRRVAVQFYPSIDSAICQADILFIPQLKPHELKRILNIVRTCPVLTIGNSKGYAEQGVHINLYRSQNTIRFEINQKAVEESTLHMSYKLYELARIVHPTRAGNK